MVEGVNYLNKLQNALHEITESFLNGGFSKKGYLLYPLARGLSKENIERIKSLQEIIKNLDSDYYSKNKSLFKRIDDKNCVKLISSLYDYFGDVDKPKTKLVRRRACREVGAGNFRKEDVAYLSPLFRLQKVGNAALKKYCSGFYLHGSFATKDYVKGWSDVDTYLILKKEAVKDYKHLLRLRDLLYKSRLLFYKIDPLQHHGFMVCTEYDLDYYNQTYLPVEALEYAESFFEDSVERIKIRGSEPENREKLKFFVDYFNQKTSFNGVYDAKFVFHLATLFPAVYLQAKGKNVYKKFSFDLAKGDFGKELWKVIDLVSEIRKRWVLPKPAPGIGLFNFNPLLGYQINAKIWDITGAVEKRNKIRQAEGAILEGMGNITAQAWKMAKWGFK